MKQYAVLLLAALLLLGIGGYTAMESKNDSAEHITTHIALNGATAAVDGTGVSVDGNTVTITTGGIYGLSGTLDGQLIIDAGKKDTVELVLGGMSVAASAGAAIYAEQAGNLILTLANGTVNTLSDAQADPQADPPGAVVFANGDLIVRGDGMLAVHANLQNGIVTKDDLIIESGTITVHAQNNGIRGKDSVTVRGGTITIDAGNDGIQADHTGDADKGWIRIKAGTLNITARHDGLQAETQLILSGGEVTIVAGGGYATASASGGENGKAVKSAGSINITDGVLYANSPDDAIHAAGTVTISGGALTLLSGDDGIHAGGAVSIAGGDVRIETSYEGIEGGTVDISGGTIALLAADDGINAAGRLSDAQDTDQRMRVTGGVIHVNAYGDGIDANGAITMTGGELYVSGPVTAANGALDYDTSFHISGGVLVAAGAIGMAQTPDSGSAQPSVIVYFVKPQAAGSAYLLMDGEGRGIISYTPDKEFQCIVFSAPELQSGGAYTLWESADGTPENAEPLFDFIISDTVTSVGDAAYGSTMHMTKP